MEFRAVLKLGGKTATGIEVPTKIVEGLGAGKKPAVRVSIKGHTYRTTVAPRGGVYLIPVSAENRNAAGISAGDTVKVDIHLDDQPREVEVPPDFAKALKRVAAAQGFFNDLSYSQQTGLRDVDRRRQEGGNSAGAHHESSHDAERRQKALRSVTSG